MIRDGREFAFPSQEIDHNGMAVGWHEPGMTLRDYFAAQAIHGLMIDRPLGEPMTAVAAQAYDLADAMVAERSK